GSHSSIYSHRYFCVCCQQYPTPHINFYSLATNRSPVSQVNSCPLSSGDTKTMVIQATLLVHLCTSMGLLSSIRTIADHRCLAIHRALYQLLYLTSLK